jgi:restriction system protein
MAVPDFQTLMLPLLKLAGDGEPHTTTEAIDRLAQQFRLSADDRAQVLQNGHLASK